MDKRFLAILIIAAFFFSITGVMADDSGSGGSDDSSASSADDSNDDSSDDSTDDSADDTANDSIDTSPTHDEQSGSADDSVDNSIDDSIDDGVADSVDDSADDSPDAGIQETETEIEHGIAIIMTDESSMLSAASPEEQSAVVTRSLVSLSSLPGAVPARIADLAGTVDDSYSHLSEAERSIRERNGIITFFFGGDDTAADDIESHVNEDSIALDEMERMVNDPSASPALKTFAQARIRIIREELTRMQALAADEREKSGLFG